MNWWSVSTVKIVCWGWWSAAGNAIGELMLEVAPAYLSDIEAANVLALLCDQIGEPLDHGLAARRYAMSGDRRALHGVVL
ncbi:hypothetical protein ABZX64_33340 [Streptomyces misionensis]|uniref:hypothetical protein n=1 Tax=Streptomyces misionensis TaxID=67331 RepID=UPI0033B4114B